MKLSHADLRTRGYRIKVGKRAWRVTHSTNQYDGRNVASGPVNLGTVHHAWKAAYEAAVHDLVKRRLVPPLVINTIPPFTLVHPAMAKVWSKSLMDEIKKSGFLTRFLSKVKVHESNAGKC